MEKSLNIKINHWSLLKFALPTMIANIFMSVYMTVDGIFVANCVNTNALSAVNIVMPYVMIVIALGTMIGTGGSAIVSSQLGEGKEKEAKQKFSFLCLTCFVACCVVSILSFMFRNPLLRLLGASDVIWDYCVDYATPLFCVAPLALVGMAFQSFFISASKPGLGMIFSLLGGVANIFLDSLFIAHLGWETLGAALATGIGYSIPGVAAISILVYTMSLLTAIYIGYGLGVAPVTSYNLGAGNTGNLKKEHRISLQLLAVMSVVMYLLGLVLRDPLISIFADKGTNVYEMAQSGYMLFSISYLYMGFNMYGSSFFTALGDGKTSAIISFCRGLVLLTVALYAMSALFGITGLWLAMPVAELLGLGITIFCMIRLKGKYHYV